MEDSIMKRSIFLGLTLTMLVISTAWAQVPETISYQGVLKDADGKIVPDGSYKITFILYNVAMEGTALWSEDQNVAINAGIFNVILGKNTPLNLKFDRTYWLSITVNQGSELSPRIELTSSAYSFCARTVPDSSLTGEKISRSQVVKSINSLKDNVNIVAGSNVKIDTSGNTIMISAASMNNGGNTLDMAYDEGGPGMGRQIVADAGAVNITGPDGLTVSGKVGIGISNPVAKLDIKHWPARQLRLHGIGATSYWDIFHNANQTNDYGLSFCDSTGTEYFALNRLNYKNSIYLRGNVGIGTYNPKGDLHIASTGDTKFRFTNGDNHEATIVYDIGSDGLEFRMGETGTDPKFFIHDHGNVGIGTINPTAKLQVAGIIHSTTGGIKFPDGSVQTTAASPGPIPYNSITSAHIVDNTIQGSDINSSTNITVGKIRGRSSSTGKWGMLGDGVAGVYGYGGSSGNYAGYFIGNVRVTGRLYKGSGSFTIDHPLDPENKYLNHSFVESPDMMNIYNGNVVLDANGEAVVQLPEWFEALNRDFRYQLTAIGAPGPNLYIAEEISNNSFRIAGGEQGMKVSWQVTGIRQDAYANANPIPVEEAKQADERGKYLHPEAFGLPETMSINYEKHQQAEQEMK